jgi:hypothetical protein
MIGFLAFSPSDSSLNLVIIYTSIPNGERTKRDVRISFIPFDPNRERVKMKARNLSSGKAAPRDPARRAISYRHQNKKIHLVCNSLELQCNSLENILKEGDPIYAGYPGTCTVRQALGFESKHLDLREFRNGAFHASRREWY